MARGFYGRVSITDSITDNLELLEASTLDAAANAVLAGGDIIRVRAHDIANVSRQERGHARDGRHMRDCIDVVLVDKPGTVVSARIFIDANNVPYAVHQEFGPHGKPFMRPAIDETRHEVHDKMAEIMRESISGGFKTQVRFRGVA